MTGRCLPAIFISALIVAVAPTAHASEPLEIVGLLGAGSPTGKGSEGHSPGVLLGASLGGRFNQLVSLHGEAEYNRLNPQDLPGLDSSGFAARVLLVPSLHFLSDRFDLSGGPTLGLFMTSGSSRFLQRTTEFSVRGRQLGLRVMALYRAHRAVAFGPMVSYARTWATKSCVRQDPTPELCDDSPDSSGQGFWNVALAIRF